MKRDYFNLDPDNKLFEMLSKEHAPKWWQILLNDKDLYCNVRMNNRINVYYRGASVMSLEWDESTNALKAKIHNYYLGNDKDLCGQPNVDYGNVELTPEEIVAYLPSIKKRVEANEKNIACLDGEEMHGKNYSSEKYVQSQMYLNDPEYIDTEFALSLDDGTPIRIDLVKLSDDGAICFEELKLVDDTRLRAKAEKPAEIIEQMSHYEQFLTEASEIEGANHEPIIVEYYDKVLKIMEKIGILRTSVKPSSVRDYVSLHIEQIYTKKTANRDKLIDQVKAVCKGFHSNIDDVLKNYQAL